MIIKIEKTKIIHMIDIHLKTIIINVTFISLFIKLMNSARMKKEGREEEKKKRGERETRKEERKERGEGEKKGGREEKETKKIKIHIGI